MNDTKSKIIDDLAGLLSGLGVAAQGVRAEIEQAIQAQLDALIAGGNFVTREEFEVVRAMAQAAREENATLKAEIEVLKAAQNASQKPTQKPRPKTAPKSPQKNRTQKPPKQSN